IGQLPFCSLALYSLHRRRAMIAGRFPLGEVSVLCGNQLFLDSSRRNRLLKHCQESLLSCCFEYIERSSSECIHAARAPKTVSSHELAKFLSNPKKDLTPCLRISGPGLSHIVLQAQNWI